MASERHSSSFVELTSSPAPERFMQQELVDMGLLACC